MVQVRIRTTVPGTDEEPSIVQSEIIQGARVEYLEISRAARMVV